MKTQHVALLAVVAFAGLLFAPTSASAQSILLTAGDYTLLGGTTISVASPGPTHIVNGNVGLWTAAESNISGFPAYGQVSGNTLSGPAAAVMITAAGTTGQAMADLQTAHTGLAGMAPNANLSGIDLGTVAPLAPGVYKFDAAAGLTGALTLDAQGHNDVFWVFQIGTTLTTAANSSVTVINAPDGGASDGIFWNAGTGAINIGDSNTVLGNYIAGTSISFTGITTVSGNGGARALALAAVSFAGPGTINALGGPSGSDWTGGLMYDGSNNVVPSAIPEPASTAALIAGFLGLVVGVRRIRRHYADRKLSI
jgi:hypothetical protein